MNWPAERIGIGIERSDRAEKLSQKISKYFDRPRTDQLHDKCMTNNCMTRSRNLLKSLIISLSLSYATLHLNLFSSALLLIKDEPVVRS